MALLWVLCLILQVAIVVAIGCFAITYAKSQKQKAEEQAKPDPVTPEALAEAERRIRESFMAQLRELELKESELARAQRSELGTTLNSRFAENMNLLQNHLKEVRSSMQQVGALNETFTKLDSGVARFNALLANVKTRGTWGEVQLQKLLEDMLVPGQFEQNVKPNPRSNKIVEFALALPGQEEGKKVWLPIDSKFPLEDYEKLLKEEDAESAERARKALMERIRTFATQVEQYISPPYTTNFAVLFLPTEGLYLEVLRDPAVVEDLRKKHILLTGPQTIAALLNALQFGFRTLAVQKQATKAWDLLTKTKKYVEEFLANCDTVEKRLDDAHTALENARKRVDQINRALRSVTLPEEEEKREDA